MPVHLDDVQRALAAKVHDGVLQAPCLAGLDALDVARAHVPGASAVHKSQEVLPGLGRPWLEPQTAPPNRRSSCGKGFAGRRDPSLLHAVDVGAGRE